MSPTAPRTAVVTGAGSGIGAAAARRLLASGWNVVLAGRRADPLEHTAAAHPAALTVPTDVTNAGDVTALFDAAQERFGRIDLLVNNAGTFGPAADVGELALAEWDAVVAVNVTGAVLCAGEAFRRMRAQRPTGGRIINNGSISAQTPRPRSAAYTTTKHAIAGLTKSIELDGRPHGITCTQLDIGNAATAMMTDLGTATGALQADGTRRAEPSFDLEEAARAIEYLADLPASASVNQLTLTAAGMPFIGRG
ncbi:SDR family oxidoreductase [Zhihengliuella flava]|uniref:NAD(P)-dependent dehydrogenase (Short-subunit alcohol dehydrogenase family) n=1 Tax=Zhihengliuella flava TaxID=1285193 RepID=A0A931D914_9MICC|nr:SDR family oxidoreductase [Zhihengliuella flava]MBG6084652.1 NAD(P)-dependent dehydrogenase (short-subunit alcohol dehydrogenase family) [Zhihengliuella flava]